VTILSYLKLVNGNTRVAEETSSEFITVL